MGLGRRCHGKGYLAPGVKENPHGSTLPWRINAEKSGMSRGLFEVFLSRPDIRPTTANGHFIHGVIRRAAGP